MAIDGAGRQATNRTADFDVDRVAGPPKFPDRRLSQLDSYLVERGFFRLFDQMSFAFVAVNSSENVI